MTLVMAYVVLISAAIGATTMVVETILRRRGVAGRWHWLSALGLTVVATVAAMVMPSPQRGSHALDILAMPVREITTTTASPLAGDDSGLLAGVDALLPFAWVLATGLLLVAIVAGQRWLRRERRRARPTELVGEKVLLSDRIGPAVAGIRTPVVFVPRWVMALDDPSQRLLMAHEMEHVRKRDTAMLFAGALATALMPWNPVVWWMGRRLRLAVEQDCDARVLAVHPGIRRYADLLLMAASRPGLTTRLLAAHFGENSSDLVRRIDTMTSNGRIPWRRVAPAIFVSGLLLGVACETPRPEPVAPIALRSEAKVSPTLVKTDSMMEIELPAERIVPSDSSMEIVLPAGNSIEVLKAGSKIPADSSVVEYEKVPEIRVMSRNPLAVNEVVKMREAQPREIADVAVIQDSGGAMRATARIVTLDERAKTLRNWTSDPNELPNILVRSVSGEELMRFRADPTRAYPVKVFNDLKPDDIDAIEVIKARNCTVAGVECPAIIVTVKKGREAAYRRK